VGRGGCGAGPPRSAVPMVPIARWTTRCSCPACLSFSSRRCDTARTCPAENGPGRS
jgi:hypothetical protein